MVNHTEWKPHIQNRSRNKPRENQEEIAVPSTLMMNAKSTAQYSGLLGDLQDVVMEEYDHNKNNREPIYKTDEIVELLAQIPDTQLVKALQIILEGLGENRLKQIADIANIENRLENINPNAKNNEYTEDKDIVAHNPNLIEKESTPKIPQEAYSKDDFDINYKSPINIDAAKEYVDEIKYRFRIGHGDKLLPFIAGEGEHSVKNVVAAYPQALFELLVAAAENGRAAPLKKILENTTFRAQLFSEELKNNFSAEGIETPSTYLANALKAKQKSMYTYRSFDIMFNDITIRQKLVEDEPTVFRDIALQGGMLNRILANREVCDAVYQTLEPEKHSDEKVNKHKILKEFIDSHKNDATLEKSEISKLRATLSRLGNQQRSYDRQL